MSKNKADGAYDVYRSTRIGVALSQTLDALMTSQSLTKVQATRILLTFDTVITRTIQKRACDTFRFKADRLRSYNFCDNVYTLLFENVEFAIKKDFVTRCKRVKVIAIDENVPTSYLGMTTEAYKSFNEENKRYKRKTTTPEKSVTKEKTKRSKKDARVPTRPAVVVDDSDNSDFSFDSNFNVK